MSKQDMDSMAQRTSQSRQTALASSEHNQTCSRNASSCTGKSYLLATESLTEEPSSVSGIGDQLSENDSNASASHEEGAVEAVPGKFLYQGQWARVKDDPSRLSLIHI